MALDPTPEFWDRLARREDAAWDRFCLEFDSLISGIPAWVRWRFTQDVQEELAQAIRAALLDSIADLRQQPAIGGFIRKVCFNKCVDQVRRQVRERRVFIDAGADPLLVENAEDPSGAFDPIREVLREERAKALALLLDRLDETCAKAIGLYYRDEHRYKEIAALLGIAVNTVGARLNKCLAKLKDLARSLPHFREYFPRLDDNPDEDPPQSG